MSENAPEAAGNIVKFQISSNFTDYAVDLSAGVVDFRYYENLLNNNVTASATVVKQDIRKIVVVVLLENKAQLMDFPLEVERELILQLKMLMVMS